jgi:site-specific DNA-methyltransferase (adenine-specific)
VTHNTLYYGGNLDILRRYIGDESVDLIYLAPFFNSNVTYNIFFGEHDACQPRAQPSVTFKKAPKAKADGP